MAACFRFQGQKFGSEGSFVLDPIVIEDSKLIAKERSLHNKVCLQQQPTLAQRDVLTINLECVDEYNSSHPQQQQQQQAAQQQQQHGVQRVQVHTHLGSATVDGQQAQGQGAWGPSSGGHGRDSPYSAGPSTTGGAGDGCAEASSGVRPLTPGTFGPLLLAEGLPGFSGRPMTPEAARPSGHGLVGASRGFVRVLSIRNDSLEAAFSAALGTRLTPGPVRPSPAFDLAWSPSRRILETLIIQETSAPPTPAPGATRGAGLGLGQQERRLAERLERLSLDMVVMSGDGNCQFRALANELFGSPELHATVRRQVVQHIRASRDEYEPFLGEDFSTYMKAMSCNGTWGDELTLRAACDSYGAVVRCITSEEANWYITYQPHKQQSSREVFLAYISPIHYNALKRRSSLRRLTSSMGSKLARMGSRSRNSSQVSLAVPEDRASPVTGRGQGAGAGEGGGGASPAAAGAGMAGTERGDPMQVGGAPPLQPGLSPFAPFSSGQGPNALGGGEVPGGDAGHGAAAGVTAGPAAGSGAGASTSHGRVSVSVLPVPTLSRDSSRKGQQEAGRETAAAGAAAVAVVGRRSEGVVSASGRSSGGVGVSGERVSPPFAGVGVTPEVSEDMVCDLRDSTGTVSSVSSGEGGSGGGAAGRAAGATAAFVRRSPPIAVPETEQPASPRSTVGFTLLNPGPRSATRLTGHQGRAAAASSSSSLAARSPAAEPSHPSSLSLAARHLGAEPSHPSSMSLAARNLGAEPSHPSAVCLAVKVSGSDPPPTSAVSPASRSPGSEAPHLSCRPGGTRGVGPEWELLSPPPSGPVGARNELDSMNELLRVAPSNRASPSSTTRSSHGAGTRAGTGVVSGQGQGVRDPGYASRGNSPPFDMCRSAGDLLPLPGSPRVGSLSVRASPRPRQAAAAVAASMGVGVQASTVQHAHVRARDGASVRSGSGAAGLGSGGGRASFGAMGPVPGPAAVQHVVSVASPQSGSAAEWPAQLSGLQEDGLLPGSPRAQPPAPPPVPAAHNRHSGSGQSVRGREQEGHEHQTKMVQQQHPLFQQEPHPGS